MAAFFFIGANFTFCLLLLMKNNITMCITNLSDGDKVMTTKFKAPETFGGDDAAYTARVTELAKSFAAAVQIDGDEVRGFLPGGVYSDVKIDDVRNAMKCEM